MLFSRYLVGVSGFLIGCLFLACGSETTAAVGRKHQVLEKVVSENVFRFPEFDPLPESFRTHYYDSISLFYMEHIREGFNGMFLVAKNGQIIYERYQGVANHVQKKRIDKHTPMHVASISKVITAYVIMQLVQEHKLELDQDIRKYLPEILYEGISVRMLLNHRSGIPYYGYFPSTVWPSGKNMTNASILRVLNSQKMDLYFPPDSQFSYCNTNYALLALIAERVEHKKFPQIARERIFEPLGMNDTFILDLSVDRDTISQSYDSRNRLQPFTNLDGVYGDKNVYTTARDLLKLDKASYSEEFLSDSLKKQMYRGYSYEHRGKSNYGLGFRMREEAGKSTFLFHTGWWHGNTGCYATLRQDTICMIVLSNHYTRKVYGINRLSTLFGNYPFAPLIDSRENYIKPDKGIAHVRKYSH